jgi:hypothetical protein
MMHEGRGALAAAVLRQRSWLVKTDLTGGIRLARGDFVTVLSGYYSDLEIPFSMCYNVALEIKSPFYK